MLGEYVCKQVLDILPLLRICRFNMPSKKKTDITRTELECLSLNDVKHCQQQKLDSRPL